MLLNVPLPVSTTVGSVRKNYGSMENKGIEIMLNTHNIKTTDFNWYTDIIFNANRNKILQLGPTGADILTNNFVGNWCGILREGEPIGTMWGLTRLGVWGTRDAVEAARYNVQPGDCRYLDRNQDGKITTDGDAGILGNSWPDWEAVITNNVTYKNFDFSIGFRAVIGLEKQDRTALFEDVANFGGGKNVLLSTWTPYNQNSDTELSEVRLLGAGAYVAFYNDDHWVKDASFIRGDAATLGYTLPASLVSKLRIQSLRVYLNAKNFSLYAPNLESLEPEGGVAWGIDPLQPGMDFYGLPIPTTVTFGINVVF